MRCAEGKYRQLKSHVNVLSENLHKNASHVLVKRRSPLPDLFEQERETSGFVERKGLGPTAIWLHW